jgi:hypothetical protein
LGEEPARRSRLPYEYVWRPERKKVAKAVGVGNGTVSRIKVTMLV